MTRVYRIPTSQVEGNGSDDDNTGEIRPYGDVGFYIGNNGKLELLMFDGVRTHVNSKVLNKGTFYGGDADSGDGAGLDTIKLVPDENLRQQGSNQYLIVDPTAPNHIHLRAGGTIDSSTADLYIGGEKNFVRISDGADNVTISTDDNLGGTKNWYFDNAGVLTLPGSGQLTNGADDARLIANSNKLDTFIRVSTFDDGDENHFIQLVANANIWQFEENGNLTLPAGFIRSTQVTGLNLASNYDVHIVADYTDNNHEWVFEASTAELTVPGAIKSKTNPPTGTQVANLPYSLGAGLNNGYVGVSPEWNAIVALGNLTGYTLTAQQTGSTIFTTTITQMRDDLGGQPAFQTADPLPGYAADITFTLTSPDHAPETVNNLELAAGNNTWTFSSTTGGLTFPDATVQSTAYPGITNTHQNTATLVVGQNIATRGNLSVRLINNNNTLDVEIKYENPSTTVKVSAYRMFPGPVNLGAGSFTRAPGNTIWSNVQNLPGEGDSVGFIVTDHSFFKIYRVTVIADLMPSESAAGEAFCTIEELK